MSKIEWTELTWNPIVGCSHVSPGCDHCYAERMAYRLACIESKKYKGDLSKVHYAGALNKKKWNGKTEFVESALTKPLHWRKPRMIFACSMSDLFHESVPFEWIDRVFAVMALCPQHTFQVLTKRSKRMLEYFSEPKTKTGNCYAGQVLPEVQFRVHRKAIAMVHERQTGNQGRQLNMWDGRWPLPNVWLGVTAEDHQRANERIPDLLKCPSATRFVSVEPMVGPVDLISYFNPLSCPNCGKVDCPDGYDVLGADVEKLFCNNCGDEVVVDILDPLDWVICGGESGPGARPMNPDCARSLRDQCKEAGVSFFFKQWGKYLPQYQLQSMDENTWRHIDENRIAPKSFGVGYAFKYWPVGKKKAGRLLDGVEHSEMPEVCK